MRFYIDIENATGDKLGPGPITSAERWRYTARMDKAGSFNFEMPATDSKAGLIQQKRKVRAWAFVDDHWIECGAGIIDRVERVPGADGKVALRVSGDGEERELTYTSVKDLKLYAGGAAVSHSTAVSAIAAFVPDWTVVADISPAHDSIYGRFNGESVLNAFIKTAEKSKNHFYRSGPRELTFVSDFTDSGIRAIKARGELRAETCAITDLSEEFNTFDLITRIYPRGSGNGDVPLTLRATERSVPDGFTLNTTENYIQNDTLVAEYGVIEKFIEFREIGPIENTDADIRSAANMLCDATLQELERRSTDLQLAILRLQIAQCSQLLLPMQSIRVDYRDTQAGLNIAQNLNILESTYEITSEEVRTISLLVSNGDRYPRTNTSVAADQAAQGQVFQAHPQLNANSYVTAYNKPVDETQTAQFRFRFGGEVVQLQQVLFEFQLLPLESTVKSLGTETGGSGEVPTTGPNVDSTGNSPLNDETGLGGPVETGSGGTVETGPTGQNTSAPNVNASGAPSVDASGAPNVNTSGGPSTNESSVPDTNNTSGPNNNNSGGPSVNTSGAPSTNDSGLPSVDLTGGPSTNATSAPNNNTTSVPSNNNTGGPSNNNSSGPNVDTTGDPEGLEIETGGQHRHPIQIAPDFVGSGLEQPVYFVPAGGGIPESFFKTLHSSSGFVIPTDAHGDHTHDLSNHTHTLSAHVHDISHTHNLNSHTHSLNLHTHDLGGHRHDLGGHTHNLGSHTHSLNNHIHDLGNHTHNLGNHTHTLGNHTHTLGNHTHTLGNHTHSLSNHTHSIAPHTHSISTHTHTLAQHTHSLNNHTHLLTPDSIIAVYGIHREINDKTFALSDLEYQINSGTWFGLETATDVSNGWRRLDITSLVQDTMTLRPLQTNNILQVRRKSAGATGKTGQLDVQMGFRTIIQSVALL